MGTEYTLLVRSTDKGMEDVSLWEHSNLLDLVISQQDPAEEDGWGDRIVKDLTPEQVVAIGLQAIKAASYWMTDVQFDDAVRCHDDQKYVSGLLAQVG